MTGDGSQLDSMQGERKGPGGPPGLQNRCGAARAVSGGFDSHALPPAAQRGTLS